MNRIHRLVFNRELGLVQVASELVRNRVTTGQTTMDGGNGGRGHGAAANPRLALVLAIVPALAVGTAAAPLHAQPVVIDDDTVTVPSDGQPSPWVIEDDLTVGGTGSAELIIEHGGEVASVTGIIGDEPDSQGSVTVDGAGSSWHNSDALRVGSGGSGALVVQNRGRVTADRTYLGVNHQDASGFVGLYSGGTLATGGVEKGAGTATLHFDGGVLQATANEADFLRNFDPGDVSIAAGGATIDSNGFDIGIGTSLSGGRLIKKGAGTLTLTGHHDVSQLYIGRFEAVGLWNPVEDGGTLRLQDGATLNAGYLNMDRVRTRVALDLAGAGTSAVFQNSALIGGTGSQVEVRVRDGARLENGLAVVGNLIDSQASVMVSGNGSLWRSNGDVHIGGSGQTGNGSLRVESGGRVESGRVRMGYGSTAIGDVVVTGAGSSWETQGEIRLGESGTGTLLIDDGAVVTSRVGTSLATGQIAAFNSPNSRGSGTVRNGATWLHEGGVLVGQYNGSQGSLTLASGGRLQTGTGSGDAANWNLVRLGSREGARGVLNIGAAAGGAADAAGVLDSERVEFGDGEATLVFNHTDAAYRFDPSLISIGDGAHRVDHLSGTTIVTGNSAGFTGSTSILGGKLQVEGALAGHINVLAGGTLSGSGTVGSTTVHDGGLLAPGSSIGTLTVDGDLTLLSGASLAFDLGSPGPADDPAAGRSDTVNVAGDLVLDGTLDLFAAGDPEGSPGLGYYRLFTYDGALQDNGLEIGQAPGLDDPARYLLQAGGQRVDLFIAALGEDTLQHWQGGDGTWSADSQQWLNQGGHVPVAWAGNHAVFRHQPGDFTGGTVTVEGTQSFHGLQFVDNGYVLEGDGQLRTDAGGAEVRVLEGVSAHISVAVAGDGGLAKTGGGTLVLSGHNLYAGGTTLAGGTLSVSADTSLGAASGGLAFDGGTLHASTSFDSSRAVTLTSHGTIETADGTTLTLAGSVSGAGSLTKTGGGTLALSGANDHAGGTTVAGGTLTGSAGSFGSGAIEVAGGAGLELEQSADGRLGNALSGTGRITKDGAGALIYSGDGARFAGTTRVRAGTLAVDGILGGTLDVLEGATLTGGGRIGRLALYGNLDLGGPGGRMDVQDDALLHAGSRWNLYAGASGQADRLSVAGRVSIDPGSTLAILAGGPGSWAPRTAYTIVTAGNGVEGGFGSVTSNLAFLAPTLVYGQDRITLALERNDVRFADRVLTRNQRAAAEGAEPLGFGHAVYEAVVTLVDDDARLAEAFDALSGEAHASSRALLLEDARAMDAAIARRLDGEVSMGQLRPDGTLLWVDGSGGQIRLGGDGNAARATASAEGLALGADVAAGERTRIGAAVGTRRALQRVNGRASRIDGDGRQLALYAGTQLGHLTLRGGVARTDYDLDLERRVGIGTLDQRLEARHEATATTWFAEAALDWNESTLPRPWLALAHTRLSSDAAAETGGSAALDVARGRHEVGTATLGLRGAWDVSGGRSVATLQADLGWRHAWGDLTPGAAAAFADGDSFTVHAPAMSRNAAVYRLGLGLAPTPRSRVAIGLQGQAGDRVRTFGGHLQWQVSF